MSGSGRLPPWAGPAAAPRATLGRGGGVSLADIDEPPGSARSRPNQARPARCTEPARSSRAALADLMQQESRLLCYPVHSSFRRRENLYLSVQNPKADEPREMTDDRMVGGDRRNQDLGICVLRTD